MNTKVKKRNFLENLTKFFVLRYFRKITNGSLEIIFPEKENLILGDKNSSEKQKLHLHDNSFFPRVAIGSDIAFGETYVDRLWDTNDLIKLLELFIDNEKAFVRNHIWSALFGRIIHSMTHQLRKNNVKNSKKNIFQ